MVLEDVKKWKVILLPYLFIHNLPSNLYRVFNRNHKESTFFILGMKRSGNHMLIKYIQQNSELNTVFYNNMGYVSSKWLCPGKGFLSLVNKKRRFLEIVSYEDKDYKKVNQKINNDGRLIVIIRDPKNLFASRFETKMDLGVRFRSSSIEREEVFRNWQNQIAEYYKRSDTLFVNYDLFISNEKYRTEVSLQLGLTRNILNRTDISKFGKGSSFSGKQSQDQLTRFDKEKHGKLFEELESKFDLTNLYKQFCLNQVQSLVND